jgi:hypothetical protein
MTRYLRRGLRIGVGLLVLVSALVIYREVDPTSTDLFPKCLFLDLTGLFCPGCGSQRAVHALLNGKFAQAMGFNAMLVVAAPAACIGWILPRVELFCGTGRRYRPVLLHRALPFLVIGFWIARNLPLSPFSVLAP